METEALVQYIASQNILQIAPKVDAPWVANVYMVNETLERIYFIGSKHRAYGERLLRDPHLAFATASHTPGDHMDRKGIQGLGTAEVATDEEDIARAVELHNKKFPEFGDEITRKHIESNLSDTCVWVIKPTYIKFWNDELYGIEGSKEFDLS